MNKYIKPVVLSNNDLAEGIYAASGGTCWTVTTKDGQEWTGSHHTFRVEGVHSTSVEHISTACTFTIDFNATVLEAYTENSWPCEVVGQSVTFTRPQHANAYQSGDRFDICIWVKAADEASTKALKVCGVHGIKCTNTVNVQGGGADGN